MPVVYTKCKTCGAELKFDPTAENWTCEYCGTSYTLEEVSKMDVRNAEHPEETKQKEADAGQTATDGSDGTLVRYKCSFCGAEVVTSADTAATFCVYCQRPILISDKLVGDLNPDGVIPFAKTKEEAMATFQEYTRKKPFLPDCFFDKLQIEKITGMYIPFWLHDIFMTGSVSGKGNVIRTWSDSRYHYTETSVYQFERAGDMRFTHIPTDAAKRIDNAVIDSIEPFDFSKIKPFASPYLAGFMAEKYSESEADCYQRAALRAKGSLEEAFAETYSRYSGVVKEQDVQQVKVHTSDYVLLPVWLLYTRYEDKDYLFAMNGQSGKFTGDLPIDKKKAFWKTLRAGALGLLASGALATLVLGLLEVMS